MAFHSKTFEKALFLFMLALIVGGTPAKAKSLLNNYDTTKASHRMTCFVGNEPVKTEIRGKKIFENNDEVGEYSESKGKVFAIEMKIMIGNLVKIYDFQNKVVTQRLDEKRPIVQQCR